jgi:4-hydroxybutyrate CoA-transferase
VIAEVNPSVVETFGDSWIHVSDLDYLVPDDRPLLPPLPPLPIAPADEGLAHYVSTLVRDGDTIQVGVGSHTTNIVRLGAFDQRQDLSYFAELTVPGLVPLAERGIVTGRFSSLHPGKFVATVIGNTAEERQAIHRNPRYEMRGLDHVLDPRVIGRNERLVAINGALGLDLSGQAAVHTLGPTIYSGVGGHLAFALGAYFAPQGRYVAVLPSTARGGAVSTIVPQFEPGQVVTVPRELADTVVTEYGVARLLGKSVRQRADELIAVAHPDFRPELRRAAQRLFWP